MHSNGRRLRDGRLPFSASQIDRLSFGRGIRSQRLLAEGSAGAFATNYAILGAEFQRRTSNLSAFREDDFATWSAP